MLDRYLDEPFSGFSKETLMFLEKLKLKKYNNKTWFDKNRKNYEIFLKAPLITLIQNLSPLLYEIDRRIIINKKSMFRINRDIRFTADKTPYRNNIAIAFTYNRIKKTDIPQFYFQISSDEYLFAAGQYSSDKFYINKIKEYIISDYDQFMSIITNKKLNSTFGDIQGEKLKRLPNLFGTINLKNKPQLSELLKMKQFYFYKTLPAKITHNPVFLERIIEDVKITSDFVEFLTHAIS